VKRVDLPSAPAGFDEARVIRRAEGSAKAATRYGPVALTLIDLGSSRSTSVGEHLTCFTLTLSAPRKLTATSAIGAGSGAAGTSTAPMSVPSLRKALATAESSTVRASPR
jgi:hypothetical protein